MFSRRPTEAVWQIHNSDTAILDEHRLRDEIDLYYPSTYLFIKGTFCHVKRCKRDDCGTCPARELRRYAARDNDRIGELMKALQEKDNAIAFLRGKVNGLEDRIASLKCTIDAKNSIIATLQGDKKLPF